MNRTLLLIIFAVVDLACIMLALTLGSPVSVDPELSIPLDYTGASFFTGLIFIVSYYIIDCYPLSRRQEADIVPRVALATLIASVVTGFTFYLLEIWRFPRLLYVIQFALTLLFTAAWRLVYIRLHGRLAYRDRIILFGPGSYENVLDYIRENLPEADVLGYISSESYSVDEVCLPYLGQPDDILPIAAGKKADLILLMPEADLSGGVASRLLSIRLERGLQVENTASFIERLTQRVPVDEINDTWLLLEYGFSLNSLRLMRRIKRVIDWSTAMGLLLLTLPVQLLTALLVRADSPGPVIYCQKRVGLGGKEFTLYKFRSMSRDAEKNGAQWAQVNDPRVTRVGRIIRKLRIDELPQLFNVIKGDMSLIGPRPERMEFVRELEKKIPYYYLRHTVKPGITGWAQVSYPYGASEEDSRIKLEYDLYYVKNISLMFDLQILLKTIGVVLFPSGAR
ncbi:MAG: sugar transferase [Desulfovibrionaceae bacterium]|nr:sugar transferase [Desulfovibrionaceae bacterium]